MLHNVLNIKVYSEYSLFEIQDADHKEKSRMPKFYKHTLEMKLIGNV